jgi:acetyl-CoA carboxylase biotin carboxylase subunit
VQVVGDNFGNFATLGDRECSMQRKNQKVIEEAPSQSISDSQRKLLYEYAICAARGVGYKSVGTVEFLLDREGQLYFIEMNARLQVEHTVSEMITGIDIVKEQLRLASDMKLSFTQKDIEICGHAIECRLNAEDPTDDFNACPGTIDFIHFPGGNGVRIDSGVYAGCEISPFYDSMIAKIIVHAKTRKEAILKMRRVLEELFVTGVKTNLGLLYMILLDADFLRGKYDTSFIDENLSRLLSLAENDLLL